MDTEITFAKWLDEHNYRTSFPSLKGFSREKFLQRQAELKVEKRKQNEKDVVKLRKKMAI